MANGDKVTKTDQEWRDLLTREQYHVLREKGTERAFSGAYYASHDQAMYVCAACGSELFQSDQKFDSGSGWPSFTAPAHDACVETEVDRSHGMTRTEVHCGRCGGHLGHVFPDGPQPTGMRYCINSVALKATPRR
jgi:peptide-methionine (R)-S-oxide reductase